MRNILNFNVMSFSACVFSEIRRHVVEKERFFFFMQLHLKCIWQHQMLISMLKYRLNVFGRTVLYKGQFNSQPKIKGELVEMKRTCVPILHTNLLKSLPEIPINKSQRETLLE